MRVEGIQVHCKKDGRQYAIAGIHGQFTTAQFSRQLDAVERWLDGAGGGIAIGDWNHVRCVAETIVLALSRSNYHIPSTNYGDARSGFHTVLEMSGVFLSSS